jgi:ppGpp synthetase/RelA/SpoT-type nucleotidyltranferase
MVSKRANNNQTEIPNDLWQKNPAIIRQFIEQRIDYEELCAEVAYILNKKLQEIEIEVSTVTRRAKTLNSFLTKIQRKKYDDPFTEITDLAGVRVVCLYTRDIDEIEKCIRAEFDVLEKVDKLNDKGPDSFGYNAIHFVVKLGKGSSGARYDDLKNLLCEIQVRTVLQDAWAIIDHHLVYKNESDVPKQLQRKLNSLAGLFETADDQFDRVRQERETYLADVRSSRSDPEQFLSNDLNKDSFTEFLLWKFPELPLEKSPGQVNILFTAMSKKRYRKLSDINEVVDKTGQIRTKLNKDLVEKAADYKDTAPVEVALSLALVDPQFRKSSILPISWSEIVAKYIE